ncbi:MAG: hypothetical protein WC710_10885 [Gallionella sp.]|jgi:hypothetical protein
MVDLLTALAVFPCAGAIDTHNSVRGGCINEKLRDSPELAASAQVWVDTLKRSNRCQMRHSQPGTESGLARLTAELSCPVLKP